MLEFSDDRTMNCTHMTHEIQSKGALNQATSFSVFFLHTCADKVHEWLHTRDNSYMPNRVTFKHTCWALWLLHMTISFMKIELLVFSLSMWALVTIENGTSMLYHKLTNANHLICLRFGYCACAMVLLTEMMIYSATNTSKSPQRFLITEWKTL